MSVALVLDLDAATSPQAAEHHRELALALAKLRDIGDRFHLVVAGRPGGAVVEPSDFRHGPLRIALDRVLSADPAEEPTWDLYEALTAGARSADGSGTDSSPGSGLVILAVSRPLGSATSKLVDLAQESALRGVVTSVVGIGEEVDLAEIDRIALAGEGYRGVLTNQSDAVALLERLLDSVGQVVARAVRLSIRLAPGVELVEVLGSAPLDPTATKPSGALEASLDIRLARELGLPVDRQVEDGGIQLLIPAFQAGDSHTVLLDVLVPGPGQVAEVVAHYKDLVWMRKGVHRLELTIGQGSEDRGPLQVSVLKNLIAIRVGQLLDLAATDVEGGHPEDALARLEWGRELLVGLPCQVPGLLGDPDLLDDLAMVEEYHQLLDHGGHPHLASSMRYAARLKMLPAPV